MKIKQIFLILFIISISAHVWAGDKLIYDCPDNIETVCIETPTPEYYSKGGTMEALKAKREAQGIAVIIVPESQIPTDRTFRNAWKRNLGNIEVDMPRARVIHLEKIKRMRDKDLLRLDKESFENMEGNRSNVATLNKKRALRNIEQTFNLQQFSTPAQLKAAWPNKLPR